VQELDHLVALAALDQPAGVVIAVTHRFLVASARFDDTTEFVMDEIKGGSQWHRC